MPFVLSSCGGGSDDDSTEYNTASPVISDMRLEREDNVALEYNASGKVSRLNGLVDVLASVSDDDAAYGVTPSLSCIAKRSDESSYTRSCSENLDLNDFVGYSLEAQLTGTDSYGDEAKQTVEVYSVEIDCETGKIYFPSSPSGAGCL